MGIVKPYDTWSDRKRFKFRLALALGVSNPHALERSLPYRVWREWKEYEKLETFGARQVDVAYAAAQLAMMWGKPKNRKAWSASDFMVDFDTAKRNQQKEATPEQMFAKMKLITQLMGGKIVDKRKRRED